MRLPKVMRYSALLSSVLLSGTTFLLSQRGIAQPRPGCDPPSANEYLLLVLNQGEGTEDQLRQLLPENAAITTCSYLNDEVVRVGGFASADIANAWAQYLSDMTGLQAFVARPAASSPAVASETTPDSPAANSSQPLNFPSPTQVSASGGTSSPVPTPTENSADPASDDRPDQSNQAEPGSFPSPTPVPESNSATSASSGTNASQAFNPQPLGSGYAVLVYYFNHPEVAVDVRQVTSQPVGLVSYDQRPFLLAAHTSDPSAATAVLQALSDRGFTAIIVDSRRAVLLTPAVVGTEG